LMIWAESPRLADGAEADVPRKSISNKIFSLSAKSDNFTLQNAAGEISRRPKVGFQPAITCHPECFHSGQATLFDVKGTGRLQ
jgi:hypothetical protein